MVKRKQKIERTMNESKKKRPPEKDEKVKDALEIDVTSFVKKFRADVKKRRKDYESFAKKFRKKKS